MLNLIDDFSAPCFFYWNNLGSQEPKYESQMMEIQDTFSTIENCVIHLISPEIWTIRHKDIFHSNLVVQIIFEDQMKRLESNSLFVIASTI